MKKLLLILWLMHGLPSLSQPPAARSIDVLKPLIAKSAADTGRVSLLLQLSSAYMAAGDKTAPNLDSALTYAQQAEALSRSLKENTWLANSFLQKAGILAEKNNLKEGKIAAQQAVNIFIKNGPAKKLAASYMALAKNYEMYDSGLVERGRLDSMAAGIYRQEHDKENEADALKGLGETLLYQGKMDKGLEKLKQCLAIYDSIKYEKVQQVYSLIGVGYTQSGNYQQGLKYGLLAVNTAEKLNDNSEATGLIYNYLAVTYNKLGQIENAAVYLKKALAICKNGKDLPLIVMLVTNIAHISLKLNNPKESLAFLDDLVRQYPNLDDLFALVQVNSLYLRAYIQLKDYKNAGTYCTRLLALAGRYAANDPALLIVYPHVCAYYLHANDLAKMLKYLLLYKVIAEKNNFVSEIRSMHLLWYQMDSASGNLSSAIAHYKLYKAFSDTLLNETETKQIAQLQVQFNTEKKDSDIVQLTRVGNFQKKELQQATLLRNYTFGGIALLIIIIGLLYNRYLIKQRSNARLQKKQKEINEKNSSLQHLLDEKQWLLKEIHHRVKNNLQIVMSLLNSQSVYLHDDAALSAIQDSRHRVQAMSLIHQKLYNTENTSTIDMPLYISELIEYMRDSFKTAQRIRFEIDIAPLELDVCQAIPIGLILNEAITNAIKYAFPGDRDGIIRIQLSGTGEQHYLLTISDNGIGIPLNFTQGKAGSLGISLIHGLSEDLDGEVVFENNKGTVIKISFVHDINIKRVEQVNQPGIMYA